MSKKPKVLFLSAGNSTRSQMAEGFLRSIADDRFEVASAGIESNAELNPLAVEVMAQDGIDISQQHSKNVGESLKEHFAFVITVCDEARERSPIFPFTPNLLHWNLADPSLSKGSHEEMLRVFGHVRDEIKTRVWRFAEEATEKLKHLEQAAVSGR
jgi:arsenate reductase (thioredoxin)